MRYVQPALLSQPSYQTRSVDTVQAVFFQGFSTSILAATHSATRYTFERHVETRIGRSVEKKDERAATRSYL